MLNRLSSNRIIVTAQRSVSLESTKSTFLCPVCYENVDTLDRFIVQACGQEKHGCCQSCASIYFKGRISEGRLTELLCPVGIAQGGCGENAGIDIESGKRAVAASATTAEIERLIDDDKAALAQFTLLTLKKNDASLCECPSCKNMCAPIAAEAPAVTCVDCGAKFCQHHAWGHKAESEKGEQSEAEVCAAFERKMIAERRLMASEFGHKSCPMCSTPTVKAGGCNHMTCKNCNGHWCWICGKEIENGNVGWHYSQDNPESGCFHFAEADQHPDVAATMEARRQRHQSLSKIRRELDCCASLPRFLTQLFCIIFLLILALLALTILPCKKCIKEKAQEVVNGAIAILVGIPFIAVLAALHSSWATFVLLVGFPAIWLIKIAVICRHQISDKDELAKVEVSCSAARMYLLETIRRSTIQFFEGMAQNEAQQPRGGVPTEPTGVALVGDGAGGSGSSGGESGHAEAAASTEEIRDAAPVENGALGRIENV
jgi:hypothetical protein